MHFYLAVNRSKDPELQFAETLRDNIVLQGSTAEILEAYLDAFGNYHFTFRREEGIVLVLGGDGTFLQCVGDLNTLGVEYPVLGINLGTLGFLTQVEQRDAMKAIDTILTGDYTLVDYPLLSASVENDSGSFRQQAFNDVVIGRQGFARVIPLEVSIDGIFAYEASCDGVLISTAYGSTAYNVSLGGPVVPPGTPVFVVTPIAPHVPGLRPIIVPDTAEITVQISGIHHSSAVGGLVTCDGRSNHMSLNEGDIITVRKHTSGGKILYPGNSKRGFFDVFRDKLLTMR